MSEGHWEDMPALPRLDVKETLALLRATVLAGNAGD